MDITYIGVYILTTGIGLELTLLTNSTPLTFINFQTSSLNVSNPKISVNLR